MSQYVSCRLVRLKIDFANMFLGAEVVHPSEAKDEERKDGHILVLKAGLESLSSAYAH